MGERIHGLEKWKKIFAGARKQMKIWHLSQILDISCIMVMEISHLVYAHVGSLEFTPQDYFPQ